MLAPLPDSLLPLLRGVDLDWAEALLVLCGVAAAFAFPRVGAKWFQKFEVWGGELARRRGLAVLVVGLLALALRAAVLPVRPIPQPTIHDEFSYLLAADTFAHGRLTNPTHPMWTHFESIHIIQRPSYMSMFYPAQGMVMAAGQVVAGHPFWGVWFSLGLMCAALCWMLQGWMPAGWAFLGGLLCVFQLAVFSYWANDYYGGAVAATGGALVLGALPRLMRNPRVRHALLLGLGLAILGNSRPYEGSFLGLAVAVALTAKLIGKKGPPLKVTLGRIIAPLLLVLIPTLCGMGYYFWRVTGSPLRIPYFVNVTTYKPIPYFPWPSIRPIPQYHHQAIKDHYLVWELRQYQFAREHPAQFAWKKTRIIVRFFFGPLLMMPVVMLLFATRWRFLAGLARPGKTRLLVLISAFSLFGTELTVVFFPHYVAPIAAALCALAMMAMRHLRMWNWRGQPVGRQLVRAVPVMAVAIFALHTTGLSFMRRRFIPPPDFGRASILAELRSLPGGQLVIVHYDPSHDSDHEWVYNDAEIDTAKVVWARDMGSIGNEELIRYFRQRRVWLLEADPSPPKLLPYPWTNDSSAESVTTNARPVSTGVHGLAKIRDP